MHVLLPLLASEVARFESFLNKNDLTHPGCWTWTGAKAKGGGRSQHWKSPGYGIFQTSTMQPKTQKAHRLAYRMWNNPVIPEGMQVQHTCDNPHCCNPDHLVLGSPKQNSQHMVRHGRAATGLRHWKGKLSDEQTQQIFEMCEKRGVDAIPKRKGRGELYADIGAQFGISESHVRNIHRGKRRRTVPQ